MMFLNPNADFAYNIQKADAGVADMGMKDKVTGKLLQATSDKAELNKKMLAWNKSFVEVNKILAEKIQKNKKNK